MRAKPGAVPSSYCIHTPDRLWERPRFGEDFEAGAFFASDGLLVCANTNGEQASAHTSTPDEVINGRRILKLLESLSKCGRVNRRNYGILCTLCPGKSQLGLSSPAANPRANPVLSSGAQRLERFCR
jgi:hypothetical protein